MIICRCKEVSLKEIKLFLKKNPSAGFPEVKLVTGASTGCGRCTPVVKKIIDGYMPLHKTDPQFRLPFD